jgi:CBS domain-containing protein
VNVPLSVRDYMTERVVTVSPDTEIMQVVHLLVEADISGVVVVDSDGAVAGIVTERDCIAVAAQAGYFDEGGGPVSEFMSCDVETVGPGDSLMDVAARMATSQHRRYPVVENGQLVGLLSRRDVLRALRMGSWFVSA